MAHACGSIMVVAASSRCAPARMHRAFTSTAQPRFLAVRPARRFPCKRHQQARLLVCATAAAATLADTQAQMVAGTQFPAVPGVYAMFDNAGKLQYVGLTRKLNLSVAGHVQSLPAELVHEVKFVEVPGGDRESLTEIWKAWVSEAVQETGEVPPGNLPDDGRWAAKRPAKPKSEIRLTPGKGLQDLTCSVEDLIDAVVKSNKVVAFVKGTRTAPSCGFSYKVLTILNEIGADYEVVNVLDEEYNPGVREAIKTYTQWPTIPQVFVDGEFVGGADIVEQMHISGELKGLLVK